MLMLIGFSTIMTFTKFNMQVKATLQYDKAVVILSTAYDLQVTKLYKVLKFKKKDTD